MKLFWFAMGMIVAAIVFTAHTASSEPYVTLGGGLIKSYQTSNDDQLEFGSEYGQAGTLEGGYRWTEGPKSFSLGLEGSFRNKKLHGQNGFRADTTADGENLHAYGLSALARMDHQYTRRAGLFGFTGAGVGRVTGLGDSDYTPILQGGAGFNFIVNDNVSTGFGYRYVYLPGVDLSGNRSNVRFHEGFAFVRYHFQ